MMKTYKVLLLALVVMVAAMLSCSTEEKGGGGFGLPGEVDLDDIPDYSTPTSSLSEKEAGELLGFLTSGYGSGFWDLLDDAHKKAFNVVTKKAYPGFYNSGDYLWGDDYNMYSKKSADYSIDYDDELYSADDGDSVAADRQKVTARFSGSESASASTSRSCLYDSAFFYWSYSYANDPQKDEWLERSNLYNITISEINATLPYNPGSGRVNGKAGGYIEVTDDSYTKFTVTRATQDEAVAEDYEIKGKARILTETESSKTVTVGLMIDDGSKGAKFLLTFASEGTTEKEQTGRSSSNYSNTLLSDISVYNNDGSKLFCTLKNVGEVPNIAGKLESLVFRRLDSASKK